MPRPSLRGEFPRRCLARSTDLSYLLVLRPTLFKEQRISQSCALLFHMDDKHSMLTDFLCKCATCKIISHLILFIKGRSPLLKEWRQQVQLYVFNHLFIMAPGTKEVFIKMWGWMNEWIIISWHFFLLWYISVSSHPIPFMVFFSQLHRFYVFFVRFFSVKIYVPCT